MTRPGAIRKRRLPWGSRMFAGAAGAGAGLLLLAALALKWRAGWRLEHSQDRVIFEAATRYSLDPAFVKAVVWKESRFHPDARGRAGEIGLMQLMDPAAQEWAETVRAYPLPERHLFDPRTNTLAGTWYLRKLLQRYRDTDHPAAYALADYNAGRGNVLRWARGDAATNSRAFIAQITFPTTREYIESVLGRWKHYQREGASSPENRRRTGPPGRPPVSSVSRPESAGSSSQT